LALFFFSLPRHPAQSPLFPYTTLFRSKAQLQAGVISGRTVLGLYSPASHKLVDISGCPVQQNEINAAADCIRSLLDELAIPPYRDRKSTRLNSSHVKISYAVFCLKKKK